MQRHTRTAVTLLVFVAAATLTVAALLQLWQADKGVAREHTRLGATPVTIFRAATLRSPAPVVLISHGFAGSQQLMHPFAVTLAKNGFIAVTFDYFGHGRNGKPLRGDVSKVEGATQYLLEQTASVAEYALKLPDANGRLSLLGHSMASDIIVRYALSEPRVDATVAVSMFSPAVTPEAPKNLLMLVGSLEAYLKDEALRVLAMVTDSPRKGVTVDTGSAAGRRRVAIAPGVEHVGVLYSQTSMGEASDWLHAVYTDRKVATTNDSEDSLNYRDARGPWIVLLLVGLCALAWPLARCLPTVSSPARGASLPWRRLLPVALIPAVGTPLLLFWFPADFLGVLVGGYLAVHFAVYGLLTAACLWWLERDHQGVSSPLSWGRFSLATLAATLYTAGVVGFALDSYVTSLAIPPLRVPLVLAMLVGTLCYFVADEWMAQGPVTARGGHLFTRFCFLLSLAIAVALSFKELFFLLIIAGIIVIYFLVYGLFSRWIYQGTGHPAVGAIANAVAFAWALAAVFPVMSPN